MAGPRRGDGPRRARSHDSGVRGSPFTGELATRASKTLPACCCASRATGSLSRTSAHPTARLESSAGRANHGPGTGPPRRRALAREALAVACSLAQATDDQAICAMVDGDRVRPSGPPPPQTEPCEAALRRIQLASAGATRRVLHGERVLAPDTLVPRIGAHDDGGGQGPARHLTGHFVFLTGGASNFVPESAITPTAILPTPTRRSGCGCVKARLGVARRQSKCSRSPAGPHRLPQSRIVAWACQHGAERSGLSGSSGTPARASRAECLPGSNMSLRRGHIRRGAASGVDPR